eukprot:TRINITY_DN2755_c0_g1_i5.p1 TRINITY_DN2755_c0_g1~~TRINITY_DN2755_c0_g1_i5.p1  ORF type:complete len:237 (-),score=49.26 TRINITY_DN2755_c0_g1_i5:723-1433(-)
MPAVPEPSVVERLSKEDLELLKQGIIKHKQTTESAHRTLKVVNEAKDIGGAALIEMKSQNDRMMKLRSQLEDIDEDVADAQLIVSWFSGCWFCQCWDLSTQKKTYQVAEEEDEFEEEEDIEITETYLARFDGDMDAAVAEIKRRRSRQRRRKRRGTIGPDKRVGGEIGKEIHEETVKQNVLFNEIETGIDEVTNIASTLQQEVDAQNKMADDMNATVERTNTRVRTMNFSRPMRGY